MSSKLRLAGFVLFLLGSPNIFSQPHFCGEILPQPPFNQDFSEHLLRRIAEAEKELIVQLELLNAVIPETSLNKIQFILDRGEDILRAVNDARLDAEERADLLNEEEELRGHLNDEIWMVAGLPENSHLGFGRLVSNVQNVVVHRVEGAERLNLRSRILLTLESYLPGEKNGRNVFLAHFNYTRAIAQFEANQSLRLHPRMGSLNEGELRQEVRQVRAELLQLDQRLYNWDRLTPKAQALIRQLHELAVRSSNAAVTDLNALFAKVIEQVFGRPVPGLSLQLAAALDHLRRGEDFTQVKKVAAKFLISMYFRDRELVNDSDELFMNISEERGLHQRLITIESALSN